MFILILFIIMVLASLFSFAFTDRRREYALIATAIFLIATIVYSILRFSTGYGSGGFRSESVYNLAPSIGIAFSIGVSGFADALLILSGIVIFIAAFIAGKHEFTQTMYSYIMITEVGLYGILISRDFLFFYIFWEVVLIPVYFMVAQYGGRNKDHVSLKFFVYTHIGSVFLLLAIFTVYAYHYDATGVFTFEIGALMQSKYIDMIPSALRYFAFFGFIFAFLVKMPSFPLHSWLPDTYETSPYPGTVILAGGLSLMGGYGLFGILMPIYSSLGTGILQLLVALGIISLLYFSFTALIQKNLKRMMAFASAGAMGFVTLSFGAGLLEGTKYTASLELAGGMFQIVAHGLIMAMIFTALYFIKISTGKETTYGLGGIYREVPMLSTFLLAGLLASLGLPGLAGFIGEFSILVGSFAAIGWLILLVILGMIVTASYHIWAAQRSLYGPYNENLGKIADLTPSRFAILIGTFAAIFILGIVPNLIYGILVSYVGGII